MKTANIGRMPIELPVTAPLETLYKLSYVAVGIMTFLSVAGLLRPATLYPTEALRQSCLPNDALNLIIGVPILLGSMWLARREKLVGLLFWPGALLYILYNYVAYAFTVPSAWATLLAIGLLVISIYALAVLVARIDGEAIKKQLTGNVREKLAAGTLIGFGVLFILRAVDIVLIKANASQIALPATEWSVLVSDLLLSLVWIVGGVALWRRSAWGYATGGGLLFIGSALFIGLVVFMLLQPLLTSAPFDASGIIVVLVMSIACTIPFALFTHGIVTRSVDPSS